MTDGLNRTIRVSCSTACASVSYPRTTGDGGSWVLGAIGDYRFETLAFRERATRPIFESRISEFYLRRSDRLQRRVRFRDVHGPRSVAWWRPRVPGALCNLQPAYISPEAPFDA